ncbi:hypothetical protein ACO0LC_11600 [Undibacterium sp. JH2W]|uniref:hypothetical protein n=1 Tax=Undibacterium sp. JH2W TaxID=3413037 RepID=UPI003BF030FE
MSAGKTKQYGKRRVSHTLPLMLVTSAALTACSVSSDNADASNSSGSQELTTIRDQYKSLEDCRKDWGDGTACETVASSTDLNAASMPATSTGNSYTGTNGSNGSNYTGYSHSFFGPYYSPGYRDTVQRNFGVSNTGSDHAISRSTTSSRSGVSRGGFGGTAHGHSGGG